MFAESASPKRYPKPQRGLSAMDNYLVCTVYSLAEGTNLQEGHHECKRVKVCTLEYFLWEVPDQRL